jgi:hypothetical protein
VVDNSAAGTPATETLHRGDKRRIGLQSRAATKETRRTFESAKVQLPKRLSEFLEDRRKFQRGRRFLTGSIAPPFRSLWPRQATFVAKEERSDTFSELASTRLLDICAFFQICII